MNKNILFQATFWIWATVSIVSAQTFKGQGIQVQISEIPKPKAPAELQILDLEFKESGDLANKMLDADEIVSVSFRLKNEGKGAAIKNILMVEPMSTLSGLNVGGTMNLGNLEPGKTEQYTFQISGSSQLEEGEASFKVWVKESNGFDSDPAVLRFNTQAFKSPMLVLSDAIFTNNEGEGRIKLGKTVHLKLLIQNRGQGVAKNVMIQIKNPDKVFAADQTDFQFASIMPNATEEINYEFFTNKQFSEKEISMEVLGTESYSKYGFQEIKSVSLEKNLAQTQIIALESQRPQDVQIVAASLVAEVDRNIPKNSNANPNRYGLIIGNEDYSSYQTGLSVESNVAFARNDAKIMKEYFLSVLGIPTENIDLNFDATAGKMNQALDRLNKIIKNTQGTAEVYVYYAGHGLPDDNKEPFLIPVDVTGANVKSGIKLMDFYSKLTEHPSKRVTVFLDACFSGAARGQELLAMRGVRIKSNSQNLSGNIVVFAASSGEQASLPYQAKQHGLFTYYFLKKLQESKGNLSYTEMYEYLQKQVGLNSVLVNNKEQNPQLLISPGVNPKLQEWKFN